MEKKGLNKQNTVLSYTAEKGKLLDVKQLAELSGFPIRNTHLALSNLERRRLVLLKFVDNFDYRGSRCKPKLVAGLNPKKIYRAKIVLGGWWIDGWKEEKEWEQEWKSLD